MTVTLKLSKETFDRWNELLDLDERFNNDDHLRDILDEVAVQVNGPIWMSLRLINSNSGPYAEVLWEDDGCEIITEITEVVKPGCEFEVEYKDERYTVVLAEG